MPTTESTPLLPSSQPSSSSITLPRTWRRALEWGLICGLAVLLFITALVFAEQKFGGHPSMNMVIKALHTNDVMEHLKALVEVAKHHHNSRSIRNGYNASAEYIIHQLEDSGACDVSTQIFPVSMWEKKENTEFIILTGDVAVFVDQQDFATLKSTAPSTLLFDNRLIEIDDLCSAQECSRTVHKKLVIAPYSYQMEENVDIAKRLAKANAAAVLFVLSRSSNPVHFEDQHNSFFESNVTLPVFVMDNNMYTILLDVMQGDYLVNIQTSVLITTTYTYNILCNWKSGDDKNKIIVGSHLDSVENSPGINAGSGAATSLAIALTLAKLSYQPTNQLVFAWWSGKEVGDAGISRYLHNMTEEQVNATTAYINLDILGSQNYIPYILRTNPTSEVVNGRSQQIAKIFEKYFDQVGYKYAHTSTTDGTEHDVFAVKAGVAYGGLYSGMGPKTPSQKRKFGGIAYVDADPCYQLACDTLDNVSTEAINLLSHAAIYVIHALSSTLNLRGYLDGTTV
ncbi:hypothetical protein K450DRAFT_217095 [Umbelopsis ramanniana AG]|uniref:Peptide hydrolase n=1 Tax=Umbelopsis ramanniana AG TaxID=1314678 RepID=A0AAD5ELL6_UMBRA|nr:uncharacterized protein K450DRAFT_217095 [Umbelopsis ramanniana AG]KAI8584605.1 hypothetical protein K450DRAFT_217095 [Umbelopsis ramanniana AG]